MTAHLIPADADLIALVQLNKQWEREDALAALEAELAAVWPKRRAARPANSARSLKSAHTRRLNEMKGVRK